MSLNADEVERYEEKIIKYNELIASIADKQAKGEIIGNFIKTINKVIGTFKGGIEIRIS